MALIRRNRTVALIAALFAVFVLLGVSASSASGASSYRVVECNPGGYVYSAPDVVRSGWIDGSVIQFGATCNSTHTDGWNKGVVLHPWTYHPGPRWARAEFDAPAGTYFESGYLRWDIGARAPCSAGACWYSAAYVGHGSTPVYIYGMGGAPTAGSSIWSHCGTRCTRIWEELSCSSFCTHFGSDPGGNPNEWYYDYVAIRDLDLTLVDRSVPDVALGGSLFDVQVAHGTPTLRIEATDIGSGVRNVSVDVNGVLVAAPGTDCPGIGTGAAWATRVRPCQNLTTSIQLDTERTPWRDGQNTLQVCVSDVSTGPGRPNTTCEQRTVAVDNSCPDSSGASGEALSITAGLEDPHTGQLRRTRAVRSSAGSAMRGQLIGSGGPVKAASVCIYETVDEPAGIDQLVQVAKSSSTGRFGVELPGGPSRTFRVAYRYADHQLESPSMYLDSSVLPTLRLTKSKLSNGRAIGFRGWIPGPSNDGRSITMQARVGKKWRSFKQLQTNSRGKFTGKYRFTQTRGRVLYVFRALVKKQGGYPYSPGASKKRTVLVHG
jgi:hypothetical protein